MTRLRRALLFMPGDSLRKIEKGAALGVDSVIMDLEDGVALSQKAAARLTIVEAFKSIDFKSTERLIRINAVGTPFFVDDLNATLGVQPDGYVIPKVENADQIIEVSARITAAERKHDWPEGAIRLIAIIESALGIVNLREIASADPRLDALAFGAEDYTGSVGATRTPGGIEVLYARSAVVAHATAFGLAALDTPFVNLNDTDDEALIADTRFAAGLGYTGKFAIHPRQVETIAHAFNPSRAAIDYAQRVLAANAKQQGTGVGVFELDGKMVDMPMVIAAETILGRARAAGLL